MELEEADIEKKLEVLRAENKEWERQFAIVMGHQGAGMKAERNGDLDRAMDEYTKAIASGRSLSKMNISSYYHSIERLTIIYRKRKDYDSEIAVINDALAESLSNKERSNMEYRLERAMTLKSKQKRTEDY